MFNLNVIGKKSVKFKGYGSTFFYLEVQSEHYANMLTYLQICLCYPSDFSLLAC